MCWMFFKDKYFIVWTTSSYNLKHHQICVGCCSRTNVLSCGPLHHTNLEIVKNVLDVVKEQKFYHLSLEPDETCLGISGGLAACCEDFVELIRW